MPDDYDVDDLDDLDDDGDVDPDGDADDDAGDGSEDDRKGKRGRDATARTLGRKLQRERSKNRELAARVAALETNSRKAGTARASKEPDVAAIAAARDEGREEASRTLGAKLVAAQAAVMLADRGVRGNPMRAARLLDLEDVPVDQNGRVDLDELAARVDDLEDEDADLFRPSRRRARADADDKDDDDGRRSGGGQRPRRRSTAAATDTGKRTASNGSGDALDVFTSAVTREMDNALGRTGNRAGSRR